MWGIEFDFVFVSVSELKCFFVQGVENNYVRAEVNMFFLWLLIDFVFVWEVQIDMVFGCGPQIAGF